MVVLWLVTIEDCLHLQWLIGASKDDTQCGAE